MLSLGKIFKSSRPQRLIFQYISSSNQMLRIHHINASSFSDENKPKRVLFGGGSGDNQKKNSNNNNNNQRDREQKDGKRDGKTFLFKGEKRAQNVQNEPVSKKVYDDEAATDIGGAKEGSKKGEQAARNNNYSSGERKKILFQSKSTPSKPESKALSEGRDERDFVAEDEIDSLGDQIREERGSGKPESDVFFKKKGPFPGANDHRVFNRDSEGLFLGNSKKERTAAFEEEKIRNEKKAQLLQRIDVLLTGEKTARNLQALMEAYLLLEKPQEVEKFFVEYQEKGFEVTESIENNLLEAYLSIDGVEGIRKAFNFVAHLSENDRFVLVSNRNLTRLIERLVATEDSASLKRLIRKLKASNYNFSSFDLSVFNPVLQRKVLGDEDFLEYARIFKNYLDFILMRRQTELTEILYNLPDLKMVFNEINQLNYPAIKLDEEGNDLCLGLVTPFLQNQNVVIEEYFNQEDLSSWLVLYCGQQGGLDTVTKVLAGIKSEAFYGDFFSQALRKFLDTNADLAFTEQEVKSSFWNTRSNIFNKKRGALNVNEAEFFLELSNRYNLLNIAFEILENKKELIKASSELFLYERMFDISSSMSLNGKNHSRIFQSLRDQCEKAGYQLSKSTLFLYEIRAFIKDELYTNAYDVFYKNYMRKFVIQYQRKKILYFLYLLCYNQVPTYEILNSESLLKRFVRNQLTDKTLLEMFDSELCEVDYMRKISGIQGDIHEYWDMNYGYYRYSLFKESLGHRWNQFKSDYLSGKMQKINKNEMLYDENEIMNNLHIYEEIDEARKHRIYRSQLLEMQVEKLLNTTRSTEDFVKLHNEIKAKREAKKGKKADGEESHEDTIIDILAQLEAWDAKSDEAKNLLPNYDFKELSQNMLNEAIIEYREEYKLVESLIKLDVDEKSLNQMWDLIAWGLVNKEPIAIHMGEKFAQIVGVKIPNVLASQIALFFNYKEKIPDELKTKFKKSQELIGPIKRSSIYENNPENESDFRSFSSSILEVGILNGMKIDPRYTLQAEQILRKRQREMLGLN